MEKYQYRYLVGLIDCDNDINRLETIRKEIPEEYADRAFILGIASESEKLKRAIKQSFEDIGKALAFDCHQNTNELWSHELLKANASELDRLRKAVSSFLFSLS